MNLPATGAFLRAVAATAAAAAPAAQAEPSGGAYTAPKASDGEIPDWLAEYNRRHDIKAEYLTVDALRQGAVPGGERKVS